MEDPIVTPEQCKAFVDEWVGLIKEAGGTEVSHTAARIVRRGAWADAMEKFVADSGYVTDMEVVDKARAWAEKALLKYDATTHSSSDHVQAPATVRNVTPDSLWPAEGFGGGSGGRY